MIRRTSDEAVVQQAILARRRVADGPADLNASWLAEAEDRRAIAEESGALLDPEDSQRLEAALHRVGVHGLLAISNDPLMVEDLVYELEASASDLDALSWAFGEMNLLLIAAQGPELAVLCTVDDFRLVAGSRDFVLSYVPDPVAAREAFLDFVETHQVEELKPLLWRATTYMDWVGKGE